MSQEWIERFDQWIFDRFKNTDFDYSQWIWIQQKNDTQNDMVWGIFIINVYKMMVYGNQ